MSDNEVAHRRFSPPLLVATGLCAALVLGIAVAGIVLSGPDHAGTPAPARRSADSGPIALVPVAAPQAASAECTALLRALPGVLPNASDRLDRRPLLAGSAPGALAWGPGAQPVVLRCGVDQPPEFVSTSELLNGSAVSGVQWFQIAADGATTWYTVDRAATVALTLPGGLSTGPIQEVSSVIAASMPAVPVHPGGG